MTLAVAWVRRTSTGAEQLVLAADSRLSGGGNLDCSPKVFCLPRTDTILGFSGQAYFAYPLVLQLIEAVAAHAPLAERAVDYPKMRTHLLKLLTSLLRAYGNFAVGMDNPKMLLLLGGYSWYHRQFMLDTIRYSMTLKKFFNQSHAVGLGSYGKVAWIGDQANEARKDLRNRLAQAHGEATLRRGSKALARFGWEPFDVLRDRLLQAAATDSIGGPPQVAVVNQHLNSAFYSVYWPARIPARPRDQLFLRGRQVFGYENVDTWALDPKAHTLHHRVFKKAALGDSDA